MVFPRFRQWLPIVLCLLLVLSSRTWAFGPLSYQVVYKGVFSAGADMPIADLRLMAQDLPGSSGLHETRIEVSSETYPLVEALFPIRYRFRNWTTASAPMRLLGFETYESTRKLRHRLYLRDDSALGVRRHDLTVGAGRLEMDQLESGMAPVSAVAEPLIDRLGLLQAVRRQKLREGATFGFDVTNGRERLNYKVRVEAAQVLRINGAALPAWKLRIDGFELGRGARWEPAHRPLYLWLSKSPGHLPLRVDSRHRIGRFRIELQTRAMLDRLALVGP